jgi:O-antigen chain-terminating methyltransferase
VRPPSLSAAAELSGRFAQGFEERFRGSREDIKRRLGVHLDRVRGQPVVTPRQPLLDIGCGRGEWLELLAEAAVPAYGIDANPEIVEACRRRGLTVARADAIEHLSHLPEGALGAISAFHLIEHLPLEDMLRLIDEARRTLVPEGILLLETPNPENLKVGALTFHQDPTHLRPLPPVLVEYLVSSRGFHAVEVMRLHPYPESSLIKEDSEAARRLNELVYGPQDVAVLARRA